MKHSTKTKKVRKASSRTVAKALGVAAVCVYVAYTLIDQQITLSKLGNIKEEYNAKIAEERMTNQRLEDELAQADTDEYLERVAREKLGLVKANERVFIDITKQ